MTSKNYLRTYFSILIIFLSGTLAINWLVDPLWFNQGNRLSNRNFPFDERDSKTRLLSNVDTSQYDCIIFGSSRATLLRESNFSPETCFNYAFSGGKAEEFLHYAKYAKAQQLDPKVVYIGIDAMNFKTDEKTVDTEPVNLPPLYRAYLSIDVLRFSLRALIKDDLWPRYYDSERAFEVAVRENLPPYEPEFEIEHSSYTCNSDRVDVYREIVAEFPEAQIIGFVPPVSAWHVVNRFYYYGNLMDCYFDALDQLSNEFDALYDFSAPSVVTQDPNNSYDSNHYYPAIQNQIADMIQGASLTFGMDVKGSTVERYRSDYLNAVETFLIDSGKPELIRNTGTHHSQRSATGVMSSKEQ